MVEQRKTLTEQAASDELASPCVRNCCLNEQDICLGCFRHLDEITGWHGMSEQQKRTILANCQQRRQAKADRR
jgi:uncharacterized protein